MIGGSRASPGFQAFAFFKTVSRSVPSTLRASWLICSRSLFLLSLVCFQKNSGSPPFMQSFVVHEAAPAGDVCLRKVPVAALKKTGCFLKFSTNSVLSHIPDLNYWHYSLQLNIYKTILERKYGEKISEMYLVCLHPIHDNYQRIRVSDMSVEVDELIKQTIAN